MEKDTDKNILSEATEGEYKYGFVTDIDTHVIPKGLDEGVIRYISSIKGEPEWLLRFRLKAYEHWKSLKVPEWAHLNIPPIDFNDISYYAAPKQKEGPKSMDEVDPELRKTFDKLGISLEEQMRLTLSKNTLARLSRIPTISMQPSTRPYFPTARLSTFPRGCAARWNCQPTSVSMPPTPDNSSARS